MIFPDFPEPQRLDDGRSWTAVLDSHDPREDDLYYVVRLNGGAPFIAHVWLGSGPSPADPAVIDALRRALSDIAVTGVTNTAYRGRMI